MKKWLLVSLVLVLILSLSSCWEEKVEDKIMEETTAQIQEETQEQIDAVQKIEEEMEADIKDISEKLESWDMTSEEAQAAMLDSMNSSETVQSQLELQKVQMPIMLEVIKENRKCLGDADDKDDVEDCMDEAKELAKKLKVEELYWEEDEDAGYEDFEWGEEDKKLMLAEMDIAIEQMENMLPCILEAEVMTDMMNCSIDE